MLTGRLTHDTSRYGDFIARVAEAYRSSAQIASTEKWRHVADVVLNPTHTCALIHKCSRPRPSFSLPLPHMALTTRTPRPTRAGGGSCGATRCVLFLGFFLVFLFVKWRDEKAGGRGEFDFSVPKSMDAKVRPHLQKANLVGFLNAHAKHDPIVAAKRLATRRHGVGYGVLKREGGVLDEGRNDGTRKRNGAFPNAWDETADKSSTGTDYSLVSTEVSPHPYDLVNVPGNPEPPAAPPGPFLNHHTRFAPGAELFQANGDE